ncbi:MAG TPA: serine/threonine-protein kinase [Thermoanaerobaculia bacterium]|jgi:serine/threonine-protein kinase|nr:serine/threonine-protein kinase [Thermoanaerobaculia bacterium]
MPLQVGESLGRYQLEQLVGQGGMAIVYRAVDTVLGRTVAVKVIRPAFTEDPQFLERFLQEARVVASLDHPNILPLYDFGEAHGAPYLVLPFLPGGSLADRIASQPQPLALVAAWLIQLAGALDAAHARGVLHRDVKPGNVLLGKDGRLVLGDFGIAKLAEATTRLTATGMVVGTPVYMAPELARGGDASPATDRYALAVMVYELIAGRPPFLGQNPLSILHQQVHEPIPSVSAQLPDLPVGVDAFLSRALAKDPAGRHRTSRAMAEELVGLLSSEQRTELSTLVWTGGTELPGGSSSEASTVVERGRTMRMPPPTAPTVGRRVQPSSTTAVTELAPARGRRLSPLVWVVAAVVLAAVALLLLRPDLLGGRPRATPENGGPGAPASGGERPRPSLPPPAILAAAPANNSNAAAAAPVAPPAQPGGATASPATQPTAPPPLTGIAGIDAGFGGRDMKRDLFDLLRRPTRRMTAGDFQRIVDGTEAEKNAAGGMHERVMALRNWALGGLAYVQGRTDDATALRRTLMTPNAPWGVGWPALAFNGNPWDLAAVYYDPKRELDGLVRPRLQTGDQLAVFAAAWSMHLDGQHAAAIRALSDAHLDPTTIPEGKGRVLVAQFLAAEALESGDEAAARRWLPIAVGGDNTHLARAFVVEMAALAREHLGAAQAIALRDEACAMGVQQLCGDGKAPSGVVPGAKPPFVDRMGRRRGPGGRFGGVPPRGAGGGGGSGNPGGASPPGDGRG